MSSRTSFAAGGLVAAFLMGALLVASLACEGGSPTAGGSCSDFLGAYVIASRDGVVTAEKADQSINPIDDDAVTPDPDTSQLLLSGGTGVTIPFPPRLATVVFTLTYPDGGFGDNVNDCSIVELIDPDATATTLKKAGTTLQPAYDVTSLYTKPGSYSVKVSTSTNPSCTGTSTLSDAWLNVVDSAGGGCCDCRGSVTCNVLDAHSSNCCWGDGDWDMWVTFDPAGTISDIQSNVLIQLNSDPYGGVPGDFVYIFSGTLACADGSFSATDSAFCASISGTLDPAGGSSGTLSILDAGDCSTVQCTSNWNDDPLNVEVCNMEEWCFLCEPVEGSMLPPSPDASTSPQLRESPVLQRLRMGR